MWFSFFITWEQCKVQDVAERYDNLRVPVASNLRVRGNIPYYGANGIQDYVAGFTHKGEFVLVAEDGANDLKNYPVQHVKGRIWVNNHAHVLQGKSGLMDNLFLAYSLHRADIASFLVGGSRAKLNADTLMTLELLLPCVAEQTKIGRLLDSLDNLITLHQRKGKYNFYPCFRIFRPLILPITWEQRKLGDEVQITMGQSPDGTTYRETPSEYILVQGNADLKDGWVCPRIWTTQKTKTAEAGDLIMSVRAPAGSMGKTAYNVVLGRGVAAIKGNEFIFQTLVKMDLDGYWKKLAAGSTFESINSDTVSSAVISLPRQDDEQGRIGEWFHLLDNLITLHQCKEKEAAVRTGVPAKTLNARILANAWEQRKAYNVADYSKGCGYSKSDLKEFGTPIILYGRLYTKYQFIIGEVDTFVVPKSGSYYSQGNEVIIPASGETAEDIARASAVGISGVLLGGDLNILHPYDFINPAFLALAISNGVAQKELAKKAQGKSVVHIHNSDIQEVPIAYPLRIEQEQIVGMFRNLDNLITLHQCKERHFLMEDELSFFTFYHVKNTSTWEQRKLGDLGKAQSGIGFPDKEQGGKTGIPFFKVSDMNNVGNELEMNRSNNYVSPDQIKKNGWSPIEETSVIFAKVGAAIMLNRKRLVRFPFLVDNNTMAYKFSDSWDIEFGRTLFERIDLTSLVQVGALPSYNAGDVENMEVAIPQRAEQYKLGALFKSLDNLITLHQRGERYKIGDFYDKGNKTKRTFL